MSSMQALQDAVDELTALRACYDDLLELAPAEAANLRFATTVLASPPEEAAVAASSVPALSGTLRLPGPQLGGAPVRLKIVLPRAPGAPAGLQVLTNAARQAADTLQQLATTTAAECAADGAPCLLLAADQLAEAVQSIAAAADAEAGAADAERQRSGEQPPAAGGTDGGGRQLRGGGRGLVLSRRCVWFHHIKNLGKRKAIVDWAKELGLGGFAKPGFPGVLLVEGDGCAVDDYLSRLRGLRWQAMAVRGEEDVPVASTQELEAARRLGRGVQELGEEDMGRLSAAAKEAGLEELFLTALKLAPR